MKYEMQIITKLTEYLYISTIQYNVYCNSVECNVYTRHVHMFILKSEFF